MEWLVLFFLKGQALKGCYLQEKVTKWSFLPFADHLMTQIKIFSKISFNFGSKRMLP
jgi:hypothetical protein